MRDKKAAVTVGIIMLCTLLSKLLGLLRDRLVAQSYGLGLEATALFNASRIPITFFDVTLGAAVLSTFIPVFNAILHPADGSEDRQGAFRFANTFITTTVSIAALFCIAAILLRGYIISAIAPGMTDADAVALTGRLLVILLPTTVFTVLVYCYVGLLQSFGEFVVPAFVSIVSNLLVIVYMLTLNTRYGIVGVAVAMLLGWVAQWAIQLPPVGKTGFGFRPVFEPLSSHMKRVYALSLPILVSSWMAPICMLINNRLASYQDGGAGMNPLEYANRLYTIVVGVFTFAITNYIFPRLSRADAADEYADTVQLSLKTMLLIISPIMAGTILLSRPIVQLLYGGNAFDDTAVTRTSIALTCYALAMLSLGANEILNKSLYAKQRVMIPMVCSIAGIVINTVAALLMFYNGVAAPYYALAAALGQILGGILLMLYVARDVAGVFNKSLLHYALRVAVCVGLMCAAVVGASYVTRNLSTLLFTVITVSCGGIVYAASGYALRLHKLGTR